MPESLVTKRMSIVPTMRCTLRCKLCSNHMPAFTNPVDASVSEMKRDIDLLFELFDRIEWLQFVGGEIFLHHGMAEIYEYCQKYRNQFDKLILETNATLLPRESEIEALCKYGSDANVMISDYGPLSTKINEFTQLLEKNGIPYVLKKYHSEDQHCGGWIDNTGRRNYGESHEAVVRQYPKCPQMRIENMHSYRGKLYSCPNSLFMGELGVLVPNERDYVDLLDDTQALEKKREVVSKFYAEPPVACHYCMWKYADTVKRYPAAEQLKK